MASLANTLIAPQGATTPPVTILDPEGDLILVIGEELHEIRINSKLLCSASKPFSVLLSGGFREGSEAQARSPTHPYRLCLEDDDAEQMRALCSILHLNRKELPSIDDIDELWLGDFVQLAHKYDLCSVAASQGQCWLRIFTHERLAAVTNQDESESVEHNSDDDEQRPEREPDLMQILKALVEAPYAFEDADGFEEATKLVILHQNHARYSIYGIEKCFSESVILPSIIVDDLGMQLETNVEKVIDLIKIRMMSLASRYRAGDYKANGKKQHGWYGSSDFHKVNYITGAHDALASQEFTEQIIAVGLWPTIDEIGGRTISEHLMQLHRFVDLPGGLYQNVAWSTTAPSVGCKACATSSSAHARELADEILGEMEGVCMTCTQRGGVLEGSLCEKCVARRDGI